MSLQETPIIRSAGPADIPALVAVHRESAEFHQGLDAQLYRIPEAQAITEMFEQVLTAWDIAISVAEVGLAVKRPFRRRGLGHALMQAAHTWAVAHGAQVMQLDCHAANEAAIRMYEQLGYHTRGYFMTKRLPSASPESCG